MTAATGDKRLQEGRATMPSQPARAASGGARVPARVPVATYRLQFHRGFRFAEAAALISYLAALGSTAVEQHARQLGDVQGERAEHVLALARRYHGASVIAVVPRLVAPLTEGTVPLPVGERCWGATALALPARLPAEAYGNVLTGEVVDPETSERGMGLRVAAALQTCPVAVLLGCGAAA